MSHPWDWQGGQMPRSSPGGRKLGAGGIDWCIKNEVYTENRSTGFKTSKVCVKNSLFWCVLRSWLWRLWNLGPCVGLAVLSRVGSLVSNRIFASAPVLICFDQSFFGISGATCIQSLLGWGTCFQDLGLGHLFWNFGSGCLFQGPALESWLGAFFSGLLVKKTILMHVCFHLPPCF